MHKIITYIANDGTEFNNEKECVAYEEELANRFQEVKDYVLALDSSGDILLFDNEDDFMNIYENISYLIITTNISPECVQFIEDCGYCAIPTKRGAYHYNNASFEWDNYLVWEPIKNYIKEYY